MSKNDVPLVLDVDGTLILSDISLEQLIQSFLRHPLRTLVLIITKRADRAKIKRAITQMYNIDVAVLPTDKRVIALTNDREVVLASGTDQLVLERLAEHLPFKSTCHGSDGQINFVADNKRQKLVELFGPGGFDYAGNSNQDLKVFPDARNIYLVNPSRGTLKKLQATGRAFTLIDRRYPSMDDWLSMLFWGPSATAGLMAFAIGLLSWNAFIMALAPTIHLAMVGLTLSLSRRRVPDALYKGRIMPTELLKILLVSMFLPILILAIF
tara:strand:- start:3089 stop:3892 length:804 start_codon:yes stop_codon:yes gene_type:complete